MLYIYTIEKYGHSQNFNFLRLKYFSTGYYWILRFLVPKQNTQMFGSYLMKITTS